MNGLLPNQGRIQRVRYIISWRLPSQAGFAIASIRKANKKHHRGAKNADLPQSSSPQASRLKAPDLRLAISSNALSKASNPLPLCHS